MPNIKFSCISNIDDELSEELRKHTNTGSSGFRHWLDLYPTRIVAVVLYAEKNVIGWSACYVGQSYSEIGVFIDEGYRRQGLATRAFDTLLTHLKRENKAVDSDMDFDRKSPISNLMENHLESFGFRTYGYKAA